MIIQIVKILIMNGFAFGFSIAILLQKISEHMIAKKWNTGIDPFWIILVPIIFGIFSAYKEISHIVKKKYFCLSYPGGYLCKAFHYYLEGNEDVQVERKDNKRIYSQLGDYKVYIRKIREFLKLARYSTKMTLSKDPFSAQINSGEELYNIIKDGLTFVRDSMWYGKKEKIISLSQTEFKKFENNFIDDLINNKGRSFLKYLKYHRKVILKYYKKGIRLKWHMGYDNLEEFILIDDNIALLYNYSTDNIASSKIVLDLDKEHYLKEYSLPADLMQTKEFILNNIVDNRDDFLQKCIKMKSTTLKPKEENRLKKQYKKSLDKILSS